MTARSNIIKVARLVAGLGRRAERYATRAELRGTPARNLNYGHIDTVNLLRRIQVEKGSPIIIYDIGANIGTWSLLALSIFPDATIEAFEPLSDHVNAFKENTQNYKNIRCHSYALGSEAGTMKLNITSYSDSASLLELTNEMERDFGVSAGMNVDVEVVALDRFVEMNQIRI